MNCPQCGDLCYDNSQRIAGGWKGPLYKCKDRACGWVQWPPKGQQGQAARAAAPPRNGPAYTWASLALTFKRCYTIAQRVVGKESKDLQDATSTLFIGATRLGLTVEPPRAPVPPPPPRTRDDFEDFPEALEDGSEDVPF